MNNKNSNIWLASGKRTPFAKIDKELKELDAIESSVPVVKSMTHNGEYLPDFTIWGTVAPNLGYSNIAREIWLDSKLDPNVPSFSTVMACSTSMVAVFQAAQMLGEAGRDLAIAGGVESMSRVQIGLKQDLSDWLRRFFQARSMGQRLESVKDLSFGDIRLHIPSVSNRSTSMSMGEHTEEMAKSWQIQREAQDKIAFQSHDRATKAQADGFFNDLIVPVSGVTHDTIPRADSTIEALAKLKPAFDRTSGNGTLTAGNSSPLTDGSGGLWLGTDEGINKLPDDLHRVKLVDWEMAAVDIFTEGLLMAPAYAIPRLLARHQLRYDQVDLWEIHEAFSAQVLSNVAALESPDFLKAKATVDFEFGEFPWDRFNPNGGSIALGHPFGATGARILSQAVKELAIMGPGKRAIVSICADGGLGTVALLES